MSFEYWVFLLQCFGHLPAAAEPTSALQIAREVLESLKQLPYPCHVESELMNPQHLNCT